MDIGKIISMAVGYEKVPDFIYDYYFNWLFQRD